MALWQPHRAGLGTVMDHAEEDKELGPGAVALKRGFVPWRFSDAGRAKMHIAGVDGCQRLPFSCAIGVTTLVVLKKRSMTP
jgi:hypothetical protein